MSTQQKFLPMKDIYGLCHYDHPIYSTPEGLDSPDKLHSNCPVDIQRRSSTGSEEGQGATRRAPLCVPVEFLTGLLSWHLLCKEQGQNSIHVTLSDLPLVPLWAVDVHKANN